MKTNFILLAIFAWLSFPSGASATPKIQWVLASDLSASELAGLTPESEHELLLKKLSQTDLQTKTISLNLEFVANGVGRDFFGFAADEKSRQRNAAVARATLDSLAKIHLHNRILDSMQSFQVAAKSEVISGNGESISKAFSLAVSKIDQALANDTIYSTLRDKYAAQPQSPSKVYGIPKSKEELQKSLAELANVPAMKKFSVHFTYTMFLGADDVLTSKSIFELSTTPGNLEKVEEIYEQAVEEVTPLVKDVKPEEVDLNIPLNVNHKSLKPILTEKLVSRINQKAELKSAYDKIRERIRKELI